MRYIDIKDKVVLITDDLYLIPDYVLEGLLTDEWGLYSMVSMLDYRPMNYPFVKLVIHAWVDTGPSKSSIMVASELVAVPGARTLVATVMIKDVPAFFFVSSTKDLWYKCYALDREACKEFVHCMIESCMSRGMEGNGLSEVSNTEDISDLTEFCGLEIVYGVRYVGRTNPL